MTVPQFHSRSRGEYAEVLVNPDAVVESDDQDSVVNMHPKSAESGPFINLRTLSRIEIRYYARMPQLPGRIAYYTLSFGEQHPEVATRMYVLYSGGTPLPIPADPVTPFTKLLERICLGAHAA